MKNFSSYFIGIPLPTTFQEDYEALLNNVGLISKNIEVVNPQTPHITIYYLAKFPTLIPSQVVEILKPEVNLLVNSVVTVGKYGFFGGENPKTLFLDTNCPENLIPFRKKMSKILNKNFAQDNFMPFYPHMTVAKVKNENYKEEFINLQPKLRKLLDCISWTFPITELALYGADSTQSPEYQKKLAVIYVN
jgi:2'-5' RNA ligase